MYRITGHYPMGLSAARDHRASKGLDIAVHEPFPSSPGCSDDDVDVRAPLCTGPVGREEARPYAVGQLHTRTVASPTPTPTPLTMTGVPSGTSAPRPSGIHDHA